MVALPKHRIRHPFLLAFEGKFPEESGGQSTSPSGSLSTQLLDFAFSYVKVKSIWSLIYLFTTACAPPTFAVSAIPPSSTTVKTLSPAQPHELQT